MQRKIATNFCHLVGVRLRWYPLPGSALDMKMKTIPIIVLAMIGFAAAETATAEAPKTQPAQEALKGVRLFIGSWTAESDA